ncbi:MAG: bifunctional riboflavin kinase/FAD synthetase [Candidatus Omnitrophota bacterium]
MKVISAIGSVKQKFQRPVVAIGVFDGLHRGHQFLIRKVIKRAKSIKGTSMAMTFFPHPVHVLKPKAYLPFLVSLEHRLKLIENLGIDVCIVIDFTKKFSRLSPKSFLEKYLVKGIRPQEVFVGQDFHFGKKRLGDWQLLQKLGRARGFKVTSIAPIKSNGRMISSTRIRQIITQGNIELAARLLGRPVSVFGRVKRGDRRGKNLGYPTANIDPFREVIPPCGVYLVKIEIKRKFFVGIANVGFRPSFKKRKRKINVEVHIFHFHKNIYGQKIEISFLKKIRDEKKFSTRKLLIEQLKKDEQNAKKLLRRINFGRKSS